MYEAKQITLSILGTICREIKKWGAERKYDQTVGTKNVFTP